MKSARRVACVESGGREAEWIGGKDERKGGGSWEKGEREEGATSWGERGTEKLGAQNRNGHLFQTVKE